MHVITKTPFKDAAEKYPNQAQAIMDTFKVLDKGQFDSPDELRQVFASLDNFKYKNKYWVINIGGNHLRLIACILFRAQQVYVKHIVTHKEYDKLSDEYRKNRD